jgi:hypothetical protein
MHHHGLRKGPSFQASSNATHLNGCNDKSGETETLSLEVRAASAKRTVVGKIEIPEALVKRRKASTVRKPGDSGLGPPPDTFEIARRHPFHSTLTRIFNRQHRNDPIFLRGAALLVLSGRNRVRPF